MSLWRRRRPVEPSSEVQAALKESAERRDHAGEVLEKAKADSERMRTVLKRNGLEPAVLAIFERRRHA